MNSHSPWSSRPIYPSPIYERNGHFKLQLRYFPLPLPHCHLASMNSHSPRSSRPTSLLCL
ncbi:hypothetical protein BDQ12DRAFT_682808 [Crucibulum laeve]|uniref:Uncharacterized protein n=1 Tax=Crucibulum laeve TaxID=68775 RepID=A0A5C3M3M9_9AGAR|nr:hypothetical protein BDQ12DRAFT_682808 [Crucibulum laeve]